MTTRTFQLEQLFFYEQVFSLQFLVDPACTCSKNLYAFAMSMRKFFLIFSLSVDASENVFRILNGFNQTY